MSYIPTKVLLALQEQGVPIPLRMITSSRRREAVCRFLKRAIWWRAPQ